MALTEKKIKDAKPKERIYQLAYGDGLSLAILPNGQKQWKYRYTGPDGKRKTKKIGDYPEFNIKKALIMTARFMDGLETLKQQHDQVKFEDVAKEWLEFKSKNSLGDMPKKGVLSLAKICIDKDFNPSIGQKEFSKIKRLDLVNVIRSIEKRGVKEPCKKACSYLNQIYDYAVSVGYIDMNIAIGLNKILLKRKVKQNYAFLNADEIIVFFKRLYETRCNPIVKKALYLKLYTGVRGAELLSAKADQFDLDKGLWYIPPIFVKQLRRRVIEGQKVPDYVIPLSRQAIEVVRSAIEWSVGDRYLFASPTKAGQHIHENTLNLAIRNMGYSKDELTAHGLRSSLSTVLHESDLFKSEWIEAQLSHTDKNAVRGTYNHAEYVEKRATMMQWWADYLDEQVRI